jgi:hypothetical protein
MRITDPRWPAVREVARILLREEQLSVHAPQWLERDLNELTLAIGDHLPSRIHFPTFSVIQDGPLRIVKTDTDRCLVEIGPNEPALDVVWLPLDQGEAWRDILETTYDLLKAGYPGCRDCAGSEAEQKWDEVVHRRNLISHAKKPS